MAQLVLDDEHFILEEEELADLVELDPMKVPSQPSVVLKHLPSGLRYVFSIITEKLLSS
jgi:hypothetical protein